MQVILANPIVHTMYYWICWHLVIHCLGLGGGHIYISVKFVLNTQSHSTDKVLHLHSQLHFMESFEHDNKNERSLRWDAIVCKINFGKSREML